MYVYNIYVNIICRRRQRWRRCCCFCFFDTLPGWPLLAPENSYADKSERAREREYKIRLKLKRERKRERERDVLPSAVLCFDLQGNNNRNHTQVFSFVLDELWSVPFVKLKSHQRVPRSIQSPKAFDFLYYQHKLTDVSTWIVALSYKCVCVCL